MTLLIAFLVFLFNNVEKQTRWAWEIIACIIWKYLLKRYTLSCNHFWRCIFRANDFWATLMSFFGRFLSNFLAMIFQLIFCLWVKKCIYILADSGFFKNFLYQGVVKSTVSWVFENLKFKISEDYKQNWSFPVSALLAVSAKQKTANRAESG